MKIFGKRSVVHHGHLYGDSVFLALNRYYFLDDRLAIGIEKGDEFLQSFFGVKGLGNECPLVIGLSTIFQINRNSFIQIGQFSHSVGQGLVAVFQGLLKNLRIGFKGYRGSSSVCGPGFAHCKVGLTALIGLLPNFSLTENSSSQ